MFYNLVKVICVFVPVICVFAKVICIFLEVFYNLAQVFYNLAQVFCVLAQEFCVFAQVFDNLAGEMSVCKLSTNLGNLHSKPFQFFIAIEKKREKPAV